LRGNRSKSTQSHDSYVREEHSTLKVHVNSGRTLSFDLQDKGERAEWLRLAGNPTFQETITGLAVLNDRTLHTLPVPKGFIRIEFTADRVVDRKTGKTIGERLDCQADGVKVSEMVYYSKTPRVTRVDLLRVGRQVFRSKDD